MLGATGDCAGIVGTMFIVSVICVGVAGIMFIAICNSCRDSGGNVYIYLLSVLETLGACVGDTWDACDAIPKVCNAMPLYRDTWGSVRRYLGIDKQ